jgi:hypothetical protein
MADNGMFAAQLNAWRIKTERDIRDVCRSSFIELMDRVIRDNPIDESPRKDMKVMVGDWQAAVGSPPTGDVSRGDPSGNAARVDVATAAQTWEPLQDESVFAANNTPYGVMLEYGLYEGEGPRTSGGFSTQAIGGFVGVHVEEFEDIVNQEAAKIG